MESEAQAWQWALDNSIVEWTPATCRMAYRCLCSYLTAAVWAQMRGVKRGKISVPVADSPVWDVLDLLADLGEVDQRHHQRPA